MDLKLLNLSAETVKTIYALMLKVESNEQVVIRGTKSVENLVKLIKVAQKSNYGAVQAAYNTFANSLNADQIGFFKTLGVSLAKRRVVENVYEKSTSAAVDNKSHVEMNQANVVKKKRIVYRGQEAWV